MTGTVTVGQTYALVADLQLQIESYSLEPLSAPMGPDRVRRTTVIVATSCETTPPVSVRSLYATAWG